MLSRAIKNRTGHRLCDHVLIMALCFAVFSMAIPAARASTASADKASTEEPKEPAVPKIPDTVVVPDPVSLTIVLRNSGTIRQIVFNIWLEATNRQAVDVIEQRLPKVINAFLVDLQRLMYRDTEQRFENREPGKRGFKYTAPGLLPPPPPRPRKNSPPRPKPPSWPKKMARKLPRNHPSARSSRFQTAISRPCKTSFCAPVRASCHPIPCVRFRSACFMTSGRVTRSRANNQNPTEINVSMLTRRSRRMGHCQTGTCRTLLL